MLYHMSAPPVVTCILLLQTYIHPGQAGEAENSSHNELYSILVSLMSRPYTPEEQLALMKHLEPQQRCK